MSTSNHSSDTPSVNQPKGCLSQLWSTPYKWPVGLAVLSIGIGLAPLGSMLTASAVAGVANCRLNEAAAHPCVVLGVDVGELLYTMGIMGWLTLASIPAAGVGLGAAVLLALLIALFRSDK